MRADLTTPVTTPRVATPGGQHQDQEQDQDQDTFECGRFQMYLHLELHHEIDNYLDFHRPPRQRNRERPALRDRLGTPRAKATLIRFRCTSTHPTTSPTWVAGEIALHI